MVWPTRYFSLPVNIRPELWAVLEPWAGASTPLSTTFTFLIHKQLDVWSALGHFDVPVATAMPFPRMVAAPTVSADFFMKLRRVISLVGETGSGD